MQMSASGSRSLKALRMAFSSGVLGNTSWALSAFFSSLLNCSRLRCGTLASMACRASVRRWRAGASSFSMAFSSNTFLMRSALVWKLRRSGRSTVMRR
ncbi:hypothetical protein FQZ97_1013040 [compost metagenome]